MPWQPGESGNPNGARGRKIMSDALALALNRAADEELARKIAGEDEDPKKIKRLHVIADQLVRKAQEGDITAIREVFDRTEGKAVQAIAGDPDAPMKLVVEILDATRREDPAPK